MAKRGRKKRDRKHSKANHGKRPNCGSKSVRASLRPVTSGFSRE